MSKQVTDSRQGVAGGHNRNAFDLSKGEHVSLVTGDDQVGLSVDRGGYALRIVSICRRTSGTRCCTTSHTSS